MKVCILSDSHDNDKLLHAAISQAEDQGAEAIIHCGDVVAANTLKLARHHHIPMHVVHGNNAGDLFALAKFTSEPDNQVQYHGQDVGIVLAGRRIFVVHFPHYAEAMAATGDWDIVCCGHSHRLSIEKIANMVGTSTWCINPGTVGGIGANATYVLADLATLEFEAVEVQQ